MLKKLLQRGEEVMVEQIIEDPTGWMVDNSISQFLLMPHSGIAYMCMFGYAFVHGEIKKSEAWLLYVRYVYYGGRSSEVDILLIIHVMAMYLKELLLHGSLKPQVFESI